MIATLERGMVSGECKRVRRGARHNNILLQKVIAPPTKNTPTEALKKPTRRPDASTRPTQQIFPRACFTPFAFKNHSHLLSVCPPILNKGCDRLLTPSLLCMLNAESRKKDKVFWVLFYVRVLAECWLCVVCVWPRVLDR